MKKSIVSKLAVVCLTAVVAIGGVSMPASAKSKGYVFKYKGVSVTMNGAAKKLIKKAGKPSKKTVKKSCAYKGQCNIAILKARKHSVSGLFLCILQMFRCPLLSSVYPCFPRLCSRNCSKIRSRKSVRNYSIKDLYYIHIITIYT